MKKITALLLAAILAVFSAACTRTDNPDETSPTATETLPPVTTEAPATTAPETTTAEVITTKAPETTTEAPATDTTAPETTAPADPDGPNPAKNRQLDVRKATTAPTVDGVVSEGEYTTVIPYDESEFFWYAHSDLDEAKKYNVVLHMSWDENYLYTAVQVKSTAPRTYDNNTPSPERPYIFDRRNIMTGMVTSDPRQEKYHPGGDLDAWEWGDAANSGYGNEWTLSAQPDGTNVNGDHFGMVSTDPDFQYHVTIGGYNEVEVYEQAIPWIALSGDYEDIEFSVKEGDIVGYAFSVTCEEVDMDTEYTIYACFGGGVSGYKNFADYVPVKLVG